MQNLNHTTAVTKAFDAKVENVISELMVKHDIGRTETEYPNIALSAEGTLELYNIVRADFIKAYQGKKATSLIFVDFGIGIGNIPEIFAKAMQEDKTFGSKLVYSTIVGFDKELPYIEYCRKNLSKTVSTLYLELVDLANPENLQTCLDFVAPRMESYGPDDKVLPIMYANRPFRDLEKQYNLEYEMFKNCPVGTYLIFPMGTVLPIDELKGVRQINANIIKKTKKYAQDKNKFD